MVKTKKYNSSFQKLSECGKKKCFRSKNIQICMKKHCSKMEKAFNNSKNAFIKQKKQNLNKSTKNVKKCYKIHCKKYSLDKIKKKQCLKKKCVKELKEVISNMM